MGGGDVAPGPDCGVWMWEEGTLSQDPTVECGCGRRGRCARTRLWSVGVGGGDVEPGPDCGVWVWEEGTLSQDPTAECGCGRRGR